MDFNNLNFLLFFLPIFLCLFLIINSTYKKWLVLLASLLFYFLYQKDNLPFILGVSLFNYIVLFSLERLGQKPKIKRTIFWLAICANLGILLYFKLASIQSSTFFNILPGASSSTDIQRISFPLGLSFFTFSVLASLIDAYKSKKSLPVNFVNYLQYVLFFPKIVVGPIMSYTAFASQTSQFSFSWDRFYKGSKRFILGLTKKVVIADQLAVIVNAGFGLDRPYYQTSIAWLLMIAFFIQIYYDFSGYIDMGIGIAHIIGFDLPENFNFSYSSKSLTEFWRRWHMTLSGWFREYVFYPLEFKRRGSRFFRVETDTLLVFLLTGLWHGVTQNFIVWGLFQGIVIVFENSRYGQWIKKLPDFFQHIYLIVIVLVSWVIFRSPSLIFSVSFFKRLIVVNQVIPTYHYSLTQPLPIINNSILLIILIGIVGLIPFSKIFVKPWSNKIKSSTFGKLALNISILFLLILSIAVTVSQNFVPSIYGQF